MANQFNKTSGQTVPVKGNKWYLIFLSFIAALGGLLFGFDTAVISGTLTFVTAKFQMDALAEGLFVSSAILGCIAGVAFSGKLSDSFGRKKVMILSALLFLVTGFGCALAGNQGSLILYRFIGGLGVGVASMISPLYISEFSPPHLRGRMVALYQLAITAGILIAYFSNSWLLGLSGTHLYSAGILNWLINEEVWRGMFGMDVFPALLFLLLLLFVPESPRWLVTRGRDKEAEFLLAKVSGAGIAAREITDIKETYESEKGTFGELFTKFYRKPLFIGLSLALLSQFSGINAVVYYGPRIMDEAGIKLSDALGSQVMIGIVNLLFTLVAILTVDRWGRKPLLIAGITGAVLSLVTAGFMFYFKVSEGLSLLVPIMVFIACFAFSFGPVCWIIISEIYPIAIRGRAMALATFALWTGCYLVSQLTPIMLKNLGPAGTFWTFAVLCSPALIITWKLVPETKGKSLEEIERFWKKH
jgi:MFS transporter, SP family, arabinose:H+ symporter